MSEQTCYLPSDYELKTGRDIEVFVSHFCSEDFKDYEDGYEIFSALTGKGICLNHNRREDPKGAFPVSEFYEYSFERFKIVLHEKRFLRYAKKLIKTLLKVDPTSILVVDEQTGKISGVWPTADELRYRIRIDELEIFGMEAGCVVVR